MTAIKKFRIAKGMTQEELVAIMGASRTAVGMWETGARMPRADKLPKLAEVLGCSVADLSTLKAREVEKYANAEQRTSRPACRGNLSRPAVGHAGRNGGLTENGNRAAHCGTDRTRTQEGCGIRQQENEGRNSRHETTLQNTSYHSGNSSH